MWITHDKRTCIIQGSCKETAFLRQFYDYGYNKGNVVPVHTMKSYRGVKV
jgi:hypothetical protein